MSFLPNLIKETKFTNLTMKNTQTFSTTQLSAAVKLLNYKNIAPAPAPTPAPSTAPQIGYKNIAPAPSSTAEGIKNRKYSQRATNVATNNHRSVGGGGGGGIGGGGAPYGVDQTQSVQRRNARERNRVKQVNNSFARLRQHLPKEIVGELTKGGGRGPQKKISKVDTLRIAVEYIRRLEDYVEDLSGSGGDYKTATASPVNSSSTMQLTHHNSYNISSPQISQDFLPQLTPQLQQSQQQQQYSSTLLTPISLAAFSPLQATKTDISCHSPTASYISNASFDSGTYEPTQQLSPEPFTNGEPAATTVANHPTNLALKFEPYDNFRLDEEDCTPDDDEIIDYISLWQEEQQQASTQN